MAEQPRSIAEIVHDAPVSEALVEVIKAIKARADKAWADRTEADKKARQSERYGDRIASAADRELHEAEYKVLCQVLGDQAVLSRLGLFD